MKDYFTDLMSDFLMEMISKLDVESEKTDVIAEVIRDVCRYFNFGCSFVYAVDYQGLFTLESSYKKSDYYEHLASQISLQAQLGDELFAQLSDRNYIMFDGEKEKDELEQALAAMFQANSLVLVPLNGKDKKVPAFVGLIDRRAKTRNRDQDIEFAYFILSIVANYIGTKLVRQRSEGSMNTMHRLLDNTGVDVYVVDFETDEILYANRSMGKAYGGTQNLIGRKCYHVIRGSENNKCRFCPKDRLLDENNQPTKPYIWNFYQEADRTWKRRISSAFYWVDGRLALCMSEVDITENQKNEAMIRRHAEYDTLTGLPNRHKLLLDCDDGLVRLKEAKQEGFVIFCDLNRFKAVNDTYGHPVGDELLKRIGVYFEQNEATRGRTYRYGGDEFVILCLDDTKEQTMNLMEQLDQDFKIPWELSIGPLRCSCSCGYTSYPEHALTTTNLLHSADVAMYEHKRETNHGE